MDIEEAVEDVLFRDMLWRQEQSIPRNGNNVRAHSLPACTVY